MVKYAILDSGATEHFFSDCDSCCGCGVHGAQMVDLLVAWLLLGLCGRSYLIIRTGACHGQLGILVGNGAKNTPPQATTIRLRIGDAFYWCVGDVGR